MQRCGERKGETTAILVWIGTMKSFLVNMLIPEWLLSKTNELY